MRLFLILLLLFPFQEKSDQFKQEISGFRNKGKFEVTYDKFQDRTRVTVGSFSIDARNTLGWRSVRLYLSARLVINQEDKSNRFVLFFGASGDEWKLLKDRDIYLIVDTKRFDLGEGSHDGDVSTRSRYLRISESLVVSIDPETFQKLGQARNAAFKVGRYELNLKDEHLEAFRDLYKLSRAR